MQRWSSIALGAGLGVFGASGCYSGIGDGGAFGNSAEDGGDGADDGADGADDGADDGDGDDGAPEGYEPSAVSLRLLLAEQYTNSIRDLLGPEAAAVASPPDNIALNGFSSIGAAQLALGDTAIDAYEESARAAADVAMQNPATLQTWMDCTPTGPDDAACMQQFVTRFGRVAFRRALADDEIEQWVTVAGTAAADAGNADAGIAAIVSGMLQSPFFLYQVEVGQADPDDADLLRLTGPEMATRLSFFLLGTTPDEALLDAAEAGELDDAAGVRTMAAELLARPAAVDALKTFVSELYRLRELSTLPKDQETFPLYNSELSAAMEQETLMFVEHVWQQGGDFRDLFDADYTFVNDVMAAHYGIPGEFGPDFVQVDLPADQKRGGILGHASVLSLLAHVTSTSPTLRGKFIRETVLCQVIPPPPPEVVTDLPPSEGNTLRERLEIHMSEPSCRACHEMMDPLGFGLESYDGIGAYRTLDNGFPIDDTAEVEGVTFSGAQELGAIVRDMPGTATCLLRNLYRHGTGHLETIDEFSELMLVNDTFADGGYRLTDGLADLVASPAFRFVGVAQ